MQQRLVQGHQRPVLGPRPGLEVTRDQRGPAIITRQLTSGITGHWPGTSVTTLRPVRLGDMARRYPSSSYDSRYSRGYMSVNSSSYLAGDRREGVSYR